MNDLLKIFEPYERKARLYPALLCSLPLIVAISATYPTLYTEIAGIAALAISFGFLYFLSQLSRDCGKAIEPKLVETWKGMPSVIVMRYSDNTISKHSKIKFHDQLKSKTNIGIDADLEKLEISNSEEANEIYRSWSDYLRSKTRDTTKFQLLFGENINYGFRRNLLGIKKVCILFNLLSLAIILAPTTATKIVTSEQISVLLIIAAYLALSTLVINESWVKVIAFEYAKRLFESADSIK